MEEQKIDLPDILTSKNKEDIKKYEELKSLKEHPFDTLNKSWNPIKI